MRNLVEFLAKSLVEHPDQVEVSVRERHDTISIQLQVAPEDTGRVIGKGGRVANAMRSVVRAAALRQGKQAMLKIR
jgi:uncharacterized protein